MPGAALQLLADTSWQDGGNASADGFTRKCRSRKREKSEKRERCRGARRCPGISGGSGTDHSIWLSCPDTMLPLHPTATSLNLVMSTASVPQREQRLSLLSRFRDSDYFGPAPAPGNRFEEAAADIAAGRKQDSPEHCK